MSGDVFALRSRIALTEAAPQSTRLNTIQGLPLFTINGRFASQKVTGVQRYAFEVTREIGALLDGSGVKVDVATPRKSDIDERFGSLVVKSFGPFAGPLWEQVALPVRCRGPLLSLCNLAPLMACHNVVCIHDANVFISPRSYSWTFRRAYQYLVPRIARRAANLATVSRHAACELASYTGVPAGRFKIMPNGHEHALRWKAGNSRMVRSIEMLSPFILLVGSFAQHKNMRRVLDLAEPLAANGITIAVVGTGDGPFAASGLSARSAIFLGRVTDDDLACLMDHAVCLAFPSKQEGFGLPIIEAMARGCPVVASDISCLPEICGGAAILTDPDCNVDWLRNISSLAFSKDRRDELVGRGRLNVKRFTWKETAAKYLDLMTGICEA